MSFSPASVSIGRGSPVVHLDPAAAMFEGMLTGWERQQLSRGLGRLTVHNNVAFIRRFASVTGEYPWSWGPEDVEDFTASLLSGKAPLSHTTLRSYHHRVKKFCSFITDPRYGWAEQCQESFGTHPVQICHEWNTHRHLAEFEAKPARRPFTYDELETFFNHADAVVDRITEAGKKGALGALRDAQFFKTVYAFGLRRTEARMLDLADLRSNPHSPQWGTYGTLHVRFGKAFKGGPPRRRTVLAVPEFDWALAGLRQWVEKARPLFTPNGSDALWITERHSRISIRHIDSRFSMLRDDAGLDKNLTLHSLRHSYVTHLIEYGYPERFVQEQVGHSYASTTAIYTSVSNDYKNRVLTAALVNVSGPQSRGHQS
jgi:integrase/recombinase XerC